RYFESIGFQKDEGPEDEAENPQVTLMTGTIPADSAHKLLRERHVQTILLIPKGATLPGGDEPVRVSLELASYLKPEQPAVLAGQEDAPADTVSVAVAALDRQRQLADQVRTLLKDQGFREAAGYDERWHTRLVGMVPANRLDALLGGLK